MLVFRMLKTTQLARGASMRIRLKAGIVATLLSFGTAGAASTASADRDALPAGFVYLEKAIPDLVVDLRYFGSDNFLGRPVAGYGRPHPVLSVEAAKALAGVQEALRPFGLGLKIFDSYRPQRAVDDFVRWAGDLDDRKAKAKYYPDVAKKDLFKEGYIAAKSSHSRGSTVDLTIVYKDAGGKTHDLDMGSPFDFFSPVSWPTSRAVTAQQRANRALLHSVMTAHGFAPYAQEWWHFTLKNEPFPDTYFDFPL
jgi:zinc D-Ala-D-Ala dipeptidase